MLAAAQTQSKLLITYSHEINRSFNNHAFGMANVPGDGRNLCKVPAQGLAVIQAQNENANRYRAILVSQIEHWRTASGIRHTQ